MFSAFSESQWRSLPAVSHYGARQLRAAILGQRITLLAIDDGCRAIAAAYIVGLSDAMLAVGYAFSALEKRAPIVAEPIAFPAFNFSDDRPAANPRAPIPDRLRRRMERTGRHSPTSWKR